MEILNGFVVVFSNVDSQIHGVMQGIRARFGERILFTMLLELLNAALGFFPAVAVNNSPVGEALKNSLQDPGAAVYRLEKGWVILGPQPEADGETELPTCESLEVILNRGEARVSRRSDDFYFD